jgi:hypothetical protein
LTRNISGTAQPIFMKPSVLWSLQLILPVAERALQFEIGCQINHMWRFPVFFDILHAIISATTHRWCSPDHVPEAPARALHSGIKIIAFWALLFFIYFCTTEIATTPFS